MLVNLIQLALAKLAATTALAEPLAAGVVLAQEVGATPDAGSVITSLIATSPLAAAMAYFAITERTHNRQLEKDHAAERAAIEVARAAERKEWEQKLAEMSAAYLALIKEALPMFHDSTTVLKDVQEAMTEQVRAAQRRGMAPEFEGKLGELIELLKAQG